MVTPAHIPPIQRKSISQAGHYEGSVLNPRERKKVIDDVTKANIKKHE
jgi:hypothetical protein